MFLTTWKLARFFPDISTSNECRMDSKHCRSFNKNRLMELLCAYQQCSESFSKGFDSLFPPALITLTEVNWIKFWYFVHVLVTQSSWTYYGVFSSPFQQMLKVITFHLIFAKSKLFAMVFIRTCGFYIFLKPRN